MPKKKIEDIHEPRPGDIVIPETIPDEVIAGKLQTLFQRNPAATVAMAAKATGADEGQVARVMDSWTATPDGPRLSGPGLGGDWVAQQEAVALGLVTGLDEAELRKILP